MSEEMKSMNADNIRGENLTLQLVVLQHLNRINYLFSSGRASVGGDTGYGYLDSYMGLYGGLCALEASVSFKLDEDYWKLASKYKMRAKQLDYSGAIDEGIEWIVLMSGWYRLLIKQLKNVGLLPTPREEVEMFD